MIWFLKPGCAHTGTVVYFALFILLCPYEHTLVLISKQIYFLYTLWNRVSSFFNASLIGNTLKLPFNTGIDVIHCDYWLKYLKLSYATIYSETDCCIIRSYEGVAAPSYSRRLYLNDGMIPKYTGYLPRKYWIEFIQYLYYLLNTRHNIYSI